MSTGKSRTVESAKHQIQGIFDKPFTFPADSCPIPVLALENDKQSLILLASKSEDLHHNS